MAGSDKVKENEKNNLEVLEPKEIKLEEGNNEEPKKKSKKNMVKEKKSEEKVLKEAPKKDEPKKEEPSVEQPKEFEDLEIVSEKMFTINLGRVLIAPPKKRAPRAINTLKEYMKRHMKSEKILITNEVNEQIWSKGIEKPPRKIKVRAVKDNENRVIIFPLKG